MFAQRARWVGLLPVIGLTIILAGVGCRRAFPLSLKLDNETRVVLEDAWVLAHTPPMLQIACRYEGENPNRTRELSAALSGTPDGHFHGGGWTRQVAIPQDGRTNGTRVLWEFGSFPRGTPNLYLRLNYRDRETGQQGQLDFKLPGPHQLRVRKMGSQ